MEKERNLGPKHGYQIKVWPTNPCFRSNLGRAFHTLLWLVQNYKNPCNRIAFISKDGLLPLEPTNRKTEQYHIQGGGSIQMITVLHTGVSENDYSVPRILGSYIRNIISSVRSSYSHPDLLLIQHPTTFSDHTGPQHWTFTF